MRAVDPGAHLRVEVGRDVGVDRGLRHVRLLVRDHLEHGGRDHQGAGIGFALRERPADRRGLLDGNVAEVDQPAQPHIDERLRPLPHEARRSDDVDQRSKAPRLEAELIESAR